MATVTSTGPSVLTPLQLTAGASLLQNQGLGVSTALTTSLTLYQNQPLIQPLLYSITNGGNQLSNTTQAQLQTIGSTTVPGLADSVPAAYSANITYSKTTPGLTGAVNTLAKQIMGNGDISKFAQIFAAAEAYITSTNLFVNSAVNSQNYLGPTFTNMDNSTSGGITAVNLATTAFSEDLTMLGNLWDLGNLDNLGSPLALTQQLFKIAGTIPALTIAFANAGVPGEIIININNPNVTVSDTAQAQMYKGMTTITGNTLAQILKLFGVTTPNINTMADLLNPYKLFPNSFQSLTAPTANGPRAIYTDASGAVNTTLLSLLPPYVISSVV